MSGRHRKKAAPRRLATALVFALAVALVVTIWVIGGPRPDQAAARFDAPPASTSQSSETPTPTTTTTTTTTTTPPPTTTTTPQTTTTTTRKGSNCSTVLAGTKPHVAQVGNFLKAKFGITDIGGAIGRAGGGDHPLGLALDFMVNSNTALGNQLAEYVLANQRAFGVTYVIWRQRYNDGSGWTYMEDRGSPTANHMDHVHVSFKSSATVNVSC